MQRMLQINGMCFKDFKACTLKSSYIWQCPFAAIFYTGLIKENACPADPRQNESAGLAFGRGNTFFCWLLWNYPKPEVRGK